MTRAAVVGLGSMGLGMARSLLRAGIEVLGHDVEAQRAEAFAGEGGRPGTLAEAAPSLDAVVLVVVSAEQAADVLFGSEGIASRLKAGALVLGCMTAHPDAARAIAARLSAMSVDYLDAPISGGAAKAAQGALTMMVSGLPRARAAAGPLLDALAETVFEMGDEAGPASAIKTVNQLLAGVHIAAAAEAMTFALAQGIAPGRTLEVISRCAGTSWMFENRGAYIVAGDYAPRSAVGIFVKDLGIVADAARDAACPVPLAAAALQQFVAAAGMGLGAEDDAAVAKVYARAAGLTLPGEDA